MELPDAYTCKPPALPRRSTTQMLIMRVTICLKPGYDVLRPHAERSKLSSHFVICVFLGYDEDQKRYHCFDPVSYEFYVSCHVFFLEHISFFFIFVESHNVFKFEFIHINPFLNDTDSFFL